jgi:NAD(P)H-nitrite reductase large subunit
VKYVIVGNGPAAISALEAIREVDRDGPITVLSKEPHLAYGRVFLPQVIDGKCELNEMLTRPEAYYERLGCEIRLGQVAAGIDRARKRVLVDRGGSLPYDKLLVATGASATVPEIPGVELEGVSVLRTIEDARNIHRWIRDARSAVVLGAGPVGLHSSEILARNGLRVSMVISSGHVLSTIAPRSATRVFEAALSSAGVALDFGRSVVAIRGDHRVREVVLDDDRSIVCDLVVIGKGVTANTELVSGLGLTVAEGIRVDSAMRTDDPDIHAAGDVVEGHDIIRQRPRLNAMWPNAVSQGRVAGLNMAGRGTVNRGNTNLNTGRFFGIPFAAIGLPQPEHPTQSHIQLRDGREYGHLVVSREANGAQRIVGAVLIGNTDGMGVLESSIRGERDVAPYIDALVESGFSHGVIAAWAQGRLQRATRRPVDTRRIQA